MGITYRKGDAAARAALFVVSPLTLSPASSPLMSAQTAPTSDAGPSFAVLRNSTIEKRKSLRDCCGFRAGPGTIIEGVPTEVVDDTSHQADARVPDNARAGLATPCRINRNRMDPAGEHSGRVSTVFFRRLLSGPLQFPGERRTEFHQQFPQLMSSAEEVEAFIEGNVCRLRHNDPHYRSRLTQHVRPRRAGKFAEQTAGIIGIGEVLG